MFCIFPFLVRLLFSNLWVLLGLLLLVLLRQIWHGFSLVVSGVLQRNRSSELRGQGWRRWHNIESHRSGQIIATSHDLTPNCGLVREIPLFQVNLGWWNVIIWLDRYSKRGPWKFDTGSSNVGYLGYLKFSPFWFWVALIQCVIHARARWLNFKSFFFSHFHLLYPKIGTLHLCTFLTGPTRA